MELKCAVQTYSWGKKGDISEAAQLAHANNGFTIDQQMTYSEFWVGTHPNGPSLIAKNNQPLLSYITENPGSLGNKTGEKNLTFLLKVLSINKPLSIQAHPNKDLAARLHAAFPDVYKDRNHKPELALALTTFEALCGFRPMEEIKRNFKEIPELTEVVGVERVRSFLKCETSCDSQNYLKTCFQELMNAEEIVITKALHNLRKRLQLADDATRRVQCAELIERLFLAFPDDVGVFSPYFLNYIQLDPGEAIFLAPNEPHAYLSGDCVECMACSDNVVRAGLTPKPKDKETLFTMLKYECAPPDSKKILPVKEDDHTLVFSPPITDFALAKITLKNEEEITLGRLVPSLILVLKGKAVSNQVQVKRGSALFLPAKQKLNFKATEDLLMFQAYTNLS